jgi:DNA-binding CsgD family transcriptional regulator
MDMEHQAVAFSPSEPAHRPLALLRVVPSGATASLVAAEQVRFELCDGIKKVLSFSTEERHVRVVLGRRVSPGPSLAPRRLRALDLLFQGVSQTAIAIELGVAASTISGELKAALQGLGIGGRVFALPPFLPQIWRLAAGGLNVRVVADPNDRTRETLLLPRVDLALSQTLAPAEVEVCRLLLEGCSHEQISIARRTAGRTVANQLAAVFAKMDVSGRLELLAHLVRHSSELVEVPALQSADGMR